MTRLEWMEEMTKQERFDHTFMDFAVGLSKLSHCLRVQVGAVLVRDGRVISTGYNGSPSGYENCSHHFKDRINEIKDKIEAVEGKNRDGGFGARAKAIDDPEFRKEHGEWSIHEVHGEANAILFAAKHGQSTNESTMYTTVSPCMDCAKAIIGAGVKRLVYLTPYDRDTYPLEFLKECGVEVERLSTKPR